MVTEALRNNRSESISGHNRIKAMGAKLSLGVKSEIFSLNVTFWIAQWLWKNSPF